MKVTPQLLDALLSPDTSLRQQAESVVPSISLSEWLEALPSLQNPAHSQLSCVLMRRAVMKETNVDVLYEVLGPALQLLPRFALQYVIAEVPASLAILDPSKTQQVTLNILQAVQNQATQGDKKVLQLLVSLAERAPKVFGPIAGTAIPGLVASLPAQSICLQLIVAAAVALKECSQDVTILSSSVISQLNADSFESLEEAATQVPELLYPILQPVLECCLSKLSIESLRVVAALGEDIKSLQIKQQWLSLAPHIAQRCFPFLLQELKETEIEEEIQDVLDEPQTLLESLLFSLNGTQCVLPLLQPTSSEWQDRYVAATAVASILEVVPHSLKNPPLDALIGLAGDEAWPVQFQAVTALGYFSLQKQDQRVLGVLAQTMKSAAVRVAAVSCEALVSYAQTHSITEEELAIIVPSLPLANENVWVQVRAVGALAMIAESAGEAFVPWYSQVMPHLVSPQKNAILQEAALEAATIVGEAVGEVFVKDAHALLQMLLPQLPDINVMKACSRIASVLKQDYRPYMEQVLPRILEKALAEPDVNFEEGDEAGLEKSKYQQVDTSDSGHTSMTVALPGRGITKITINTNQIQEKSQAISCLTIHAEALGEFFPHAYIEKIVPLLSFRFSPDVRRAAALATAAIFEATCAGDEAYGSRTAASYLPVIANALINQLSIEDTIDIETMYALADALSDTYCSVNCRLDSNGRYLLSSFSLKQATPLVETCVNAITSCLSRRKELTDVLVLASGDDEKQEIELQLRAEEDLLRPLVDSIGYTLKFFKQDFVPIFESTVVPVLGPCLSASEDTRALFAAVCLFDDCVEHCGEQAAEKYAPALFEGIKIGLNDHTNGGDDELKQVSIYGLAQITRYTSGKSLAPNAAAIVQELGTIASSPKEEAENLFLHENAVSAFASLLLIGKAPFKGSGFVKHEDAAQLFLNNLPLREDEDEASICHSGLCDLVESGTISYKQQSQVLLPKIAEIFACVEDGEDLASEETLVRLVGILLRIQQDVLNVQSLFASLDETQQSAINAVVENYAHRLSNVITP